MTLSHTFLFSSNILTTFCGSEVSGVPGFDLSGKYYHVKSNQEYSSGNYLMKPYETVVELSLQEVKESFDEVDERLDNSNLMDITEVSGISSIFIFILIIVAVIRSIMKKVSILERTQQRYMEGDSSAKFKSFMKLLKPDPQSDDMFLEI